MRLVMAMVLAGLMALPLSASAQVGEEGAQLAFLLIPEHLRERLPQHRHSAPEPENKLNLEYQEQRSPEVEEMELRVKRAWIGFGVSGGAAVVGLTLTLVAYGQSSLAGPYPGWVDPVIATGLAVGLAGACGMISSAALVGVRKRKLRELQQAHYRTPRRVQWDVARSRLVF